jgi:hypothetical protein
MLLSITGDCRTFRARAAGRLIYHGGAYDPFISQSHRSTNARKGRPEIPGAISEDEILGTKGNRFLQAHEIGVVHHDTASSAGMAEEAARRWIFIGLMWRFATKIENKLDKFFDIRFLF